MPTLVTGTHEGGGSAHRNAEPPLVDQAAACLVPAAEEGVRRAADAQPLVARPGEQPLSVLEFHAERLLGIDVLAGVEGLKPDFDMSPGNCQVDHHFYLGIGKQGVDTGGRQAEFVGARLCGLGHQVRDASDVKDREHLRGGQIGRGNVAAADDADADGIFSL